MVKVNVDDNQGLARRFDAMSIPTIIVLRDGAVVNRIVGAAPKEQLAAQITPHLKPPRRTVAPPRPEREGRLASPAGFEPATFRLEGGCSVH